MVTYKNEKSSTQWIKFKSNESTWQMPFKISDCSFNARDHIFSYLLIHQISTCLKFGCAQQSPRSLSRPQCMVHFVFNFAIWLCIGHPASSAHYSIYFMHITFNQFCEGLFPERRCWDSWRCAWISDCASHRARLHFEYAIWKSHPTAPRCLAGFFSPLPLSEQASSELKAKYPYSHLTKLKSTRTNLPSISVRSSFDRKIPADRIVFF